MHSPLNPKLKKKKKVSKWERNLSFGSAAKSQLWTVPKSKPFRFRNDAIIKSNSSTLFEFYLFTFFFFTDKSMKLQVRYIIWISRIKKFIIYGMSGNSLL